MPNSDQQSNSFDSQSPTYLGSEEQIAARLTAGVDNDIISPKHGNVSRKEDREPLRTIGEFTLVREIGRGGMGVVYEATQASLDRRVALKTLPVSGRMDQRQIQRFQNEARAAAQLQHPNIVPVFSIGTEAGIHYYAMQLIPGHDLAHFIRQAKTLLESPRAPRSGDTPKFALGTTAQVFQPTPGVLRTGTDSAVAEGSTLSVPLSGFIDMMADHKSSVADRKAFESILQIGIQAAEALHFAHQLGIVHRDIKPSNLMLDNEGKLWVTDFGLAQIQGAGALTMTGEVIGTLRYMSPEQPLGQRVLVDQRTDVYSLGVTLYELLTFRKAFGGDTPKEIIRQVCFDEPVSIRRLNPRVPEDLETIVLKAMSKNPDDRYQSAQELADDLERFRTDQPISARRPTLLQQGRRWIRRHVALATSVAVGIVLLLLTSLTATGMIWNSLNAETQQRQRAESLLDKSEGLRLIANSTLMKEENPGLALLLAVRGAELNPGVDANTALLNGLGNNHELRTFSPRKEPLGAFCVSPDGKRIVSTVPKSFVADGFFPAIESDLASGKALRTFDDGTTLTSAAYSPNGRFLLFTTDPHRRINKAEIKTLPTDDVIESGSTPTLWDAGTGEKKITFHEASLIAVQGSEFSPSSGEVALPGKDHSVKIYSTADGRLNSVLNGHSDTILSIAFSADGQRLLTVAKDETVRVWDLASGMELRQFRVGLKSERSVVAAFAGNSGRLLISSSAGTRLFSVESGEQINPRHWPETSSRISPDGHWLVLFSQFAERVSIWDLQTFVRISTFNAADRVVSVDISDNSKSLLISTVSAAEIHRIEDGSVLAHLKGHTERVVAGSFAPGGNELITISRDRAVRYWRARNGLQQSVVMSDPAENLPSPWSFSHDGKMVVVATRPTLKTELRDLDGRLRSTQHAGVVIPRAAGSERLVTVDYDEVIVWHAPSSRRIASVRFEMDSVRNALAVPGSDNVLIHLQNGGAILWNSTTGMRKPVSNPGETVTAIDVHPTEEKVIVAEACGDCRILHGRTAEVLKELSHRDGVIQVVYSPSGAKIASIDSQNTARVWAIDQEAPPQTFHKPNGHIGDALFSGDETVLITWSRQKADSLRCWNTTTAELLKETKVQSVPGVDVHPVLPLVAVASANHGLIYWNWETGDEKVVTTVPTTAPRFTKDRLITIEAADTFHASKVPIWNHATREEFVRSTIAVRNAGTGEHLASEPLTVAPANLTVDRNSDQIILSHRTFSSRLIRMDNHATVAETGGLAGPIVFQGFISDTTNVVTVGMDGRASLWDQTGRQLRLLTEHNQPFAKACLSVDGLRMATFDLSGDGILWDLEKGQPIQHWPANGRTLQSAEFSASGRSLMAASQDGTVWIRDLISRTERELKFKPGVLHAEWSPDEGQLLLVTGQPPAEDGAKPLEGQASGALLLEIKSGKQTVFAVNDTPGIGHFRPNGKQVALLSNNGRVSLIDGSTGQIIEAFDPNRRRILNLAFSRDGAELLVQHEDELSLWKVEPCEEILRIPLGDKNSMPPSMLIQAPWVPFTVDGSAILSSNPAIHKWPRNPLSQAYSEIPRSMSSAEMRQFLIKPSNALEPAN